MYFFSIVSSIKHGLPFCVGKLSLEDVVIPKDQGKKLFLSNCPIVIYDECTDDISITGPANTLHVVLKSLLDQGKVPYLLAGMYV